MTTTTFDEVRATGAGGVAWCPFEAFETLRRGGWSLHFAGELPWGALGITRYSDRTVWIVRGLTARQYRTVLAHEVIHAERGSRRELGLRKDEDEAQVDLEVIQRLVPLERYLAGRSRARNDAHLARLLDVDAYAVQEARTAYADA